jgi:hypothetical protein
LKIPFDKYTIDSFLDYIANNLDSVMESRGERKWLKCHLLYTVDDWKNLFSEPPEQMGEIWHIVLRDEYDKPADYYIYQWREGIIACFTTSTEDLYENTLQKFIQRHRGISEAWIRPDLFEKMKDFLLTKYQAHIYQFISRRSRFSNVPTDIGRPDYQRRINYSGEDAGDVLKETQRLYGTIPLTISFRIGEDKIKLNRNGLFVIMNINRKTTRMILEVTESTIVEQMQLLQTSEKFITANKKLELRGKKELVIPTVVAGKIVLPSSTFNQSKIKVLFGEPLVDMGFPEGEAQQDGLEFTSSSFSFIDTFVSKDATSFSATVVDDIKGTLFGVTGGNNEIILVPKHRTSFESFLSFYERIVESFDQSAYLTTFGDVVGR